MTEHQALQWIETHECILDIKPRRMRLYYGMYVFVSCDGDIGMRLIDCVTQAKEGKIRVQDAEPNNPPQAQR